MGQTIYVDVLIIINIYINYGLLLLTCFARKLVPQRLKILLSSLFGGIYSLIILIPGISDAIITLSRIPALLIIVYLAFGYVNKSGYIKNVCCFFGINLIFGGAMFMLWFLVAPGNMYYNSGVVYFGIDAFTLVVFTVCAYGLIRLVSLLNKDKIPHNLIYGMNINIGDREFSCRAFYDSGNCVCDPFSGEGVTVVNIEVLKGLVLESVFESFESTDTEILIKPIPVKTISGTKLLPAFRADKIKIKCLEKTVFLEKPIIALCKEKIHGGDYGALLYSSVFENTTNEKGENYVWHT